MEISISNQKKKQKKHAVNSIDILDGENWRGFYLNVRTNNCIFENQVH